MNVGRVEKGRFCPLKESDLERVDYAFHPMRRHTRGQGAGGGGFEGGKKREGRSRENLPTRDHDKITLQDHTPRKDRIAFVRQHPCHLTPREPSSRPPLFRFAKTTASYKVDRRGPKKRVKARVYRRLRSGGKFWKEARSRLRDNPNKSEKRNEGTIMRGSRNGFPRRRA